MRLPYETEGNLRSGAPPRFGVVLLRTDEILEREFPLLLAGSEARVHYSRLPSSDDITAGGLAAMEACLPDAVGLLPPKVPYDVIALACTSGCTIIGEDRVADMIHGVHPGVAVSNPMTAAKAALRVLGVGRIGFVTPYVAEITSAMRSHLADNGIETVSFGSFEVAEDAVVARMTPQCVLEAALAIGGAADCEAVFISCTNLPAIDVIAAAEARLGKPVICSNQALAWHMLRLAGDATPRRGLGRLFTLPLI